MLKIEITQIALSQMNLTEDENDPNKKPFVKNSEIAAQLGIEQTTIYNTRQCLKFARANGISDNCHVVYAWRWNANDRHAKIGHCPIGNLLYRIITTYEPIDDPLLIGVKECSNKKEAGKFASGILYRLERSRPDRNRHEWVIINETFNEIIDKEFTRIEKIVKK